MYLLGLGLALAAPRLITVSRELLLDDRCMQENDFGRRRTLSPSVIDSCWSTDDPDVGDPVLGEGSPELIPESRLDFTEIKYIIIIMRFYFHLD